ncbi:MAG: hypothetical protein H6905_06520 [Hyphomicrobiales bacterium]|nr:hypothetical protein [Hyphomicrobiales bacterium]
MATLIFSGFLALGLGSRSARSFSPDAPIAESAVVSEQSAIVPGRPFLVALRLKLPETWHTYWSNPGDSGVPASIKWILPYGFTAGPILWPTPERIVVEGPIVSYGHHGEVLLITEIRPPNLLPANTEIPIAADAEWLVCAEICVPEHAALSIRLPVSTADRPTDARWRDSFSRARTLLPKPMPGSATFHVSGETLVLSVDSKALAKGALSEAWFFPDTTGVIDHAALQLPSMRDGRLTISIPRDPNGTPLNAALSGVLVLTTDGGKSAFNIHAVEAGTRRFP